MEEDKKKYEISFILKLEEAAESVLKALTGQGAAVETKSDPVKIKLSYPIKKETSGYFMCVVFSLEPDRVQALEDNLRHMNEVLRFLLVTPPIVKEERRERIASGSRPPKNLLPEKPKKEPEPQPEVLTNELLEKKLEEILK